MREPPSALIVAPSKPVRRSARDVLKRLGFRVDTAPEPFEAVARFSEAPSDLVVISLAGARSRDLAMLKTQKRRAPSSRILLLVPEGQRALAHRGLAVGADASLPDPFHPAELKSLARCLVPVEDAEDPAGLPASGPGLSLLAGEVAHAVNNPLQILTLLKEQLPQEGRTRDILTQEVTRIRNVVRILDRFGRVGPARRVAGSLTSLVKERLEEAEHAGAIGLVELVLQDVPPFAFDPVQVPHAVDCMLDVLVGHATDRPVPVRARVRPTKVDGRAAVEIALKARGVHLDEDALEGLGRSVIWNDEDTRRSHAGLALPFAVARRHGGRLVAEPTRSGTLLRLLLAP